MELKITIKIEGDEVKDFNVDVCKDEVDLKNSYSQYARFFDEGCTDKLQLACTDPEYKLMFLRQTEVYATEKLKAQGYLFLNDVYEMLGIPKIKAGQFVGWIYDEENPVGDNYVDFGIYKLGNKDFVNGFERSILLDFNVDGNILEKLN